MHKAAPVSQIHRSIREVQGCSPKRKRTGTLAHRERCSASLYRGFGGGAPSRVQGQPWGGPSLRITFKMAGAVFVARRNHLHAGVYTVLTRDFL